MTSEEQPIQKKARSSFGGNQGQLGFSDVAASISASTFAARRLPEIKQLWRSCMVAGNQDGIFHCSDSMPDRSAGCITSSRHLRRRATSHKPYHRRRDHQKKIRGDTNQEVSADSKEPQLTVDCSRRVRRKQRHVLRQSHESSWTKCLTAEQAAHDEKNAVRWMPTHLWHAKRFHMSELWGWKLPLIHINRGSKSALRLLRERKTALQDLTWRTQPVWLKFHLGSFRDLQNALIRVIPAFNSQIITDFDTSDRVGESIFFDVDKFPSSAVGPVFWILRRSSPLLSEALAEDKDHAYIYICSHPSILSKVRLAVQTVVRDIDGVEGPHMSVDGGMSCFRLRGLSCSDALSLAMQAIEGMDGALKDWSNRNTMDNESESKMDYLSCSSTGSGVVLIRRQQTRNPHLPCNFGSVSIDIICNPELARKLWLNLVLNDCFPIGLGEEAHFNLECEPPMSVFPRDFPDSEQGNLYWTMSSKEWTIVRNVYEGGQGRVDLKRISCFPVNWNVLIPVDMQVADKSVVVVRGAFRQPFSDTLQHSGMAFEKSSSAPEKSSRKRRRSRNPSNLVQLSPLPQDLWKEHDASVQTLRNSLSLPAVLVVQVQLYGPGTLSAGTRLHALHSPDMPLGFVTGGTFSHTRGRPHAIGIVGAARFLDAISNSRLDKTSVLVRRLDSTKEVGLVVHALDESVWHRACISLIA